MIKVFIDTDVIIDFLADRKPFCDSAASLFNRIGKKEIEGYTSSQSICNLYFILRKLETRQVIVQTLRELTSIIGILPVDGEMVQKALQSSFPDVEDAIQNFCAEAGGIDVIVTRNFKDYRKSGIAVMSADLVRL